MASKLSTEDVAILAQQDMWILARWWCLLNSWKWPKELPNEEPRTYVPGGRRGQLMAWIHEAVGHRNISRVWNQDMTDEEFNDFWRGTYEGHQPSRERHRKRVKDKFKQRVTTTGE